MAGEALEQLASSERGMSSVRRPASSTVEQHAGQPYHLVLVQDGEEKGRPWTASVDELPGCTSRGKTSEEALSGIRNAMTGWIEGALREGRDIPEPKSATSHSGRLLLRMPRTLHADLTRASERERVSLNQFITDVLAAAVGWRSGSAAEADPSATATSIIHAPGAEGLTAEPTATRRGQRSPSRVVVGALAANFMLVAGAAIVAIVVLVRDLL
jgi:antitoxin HicB